MKACVLSAGAPVGRRRLECTDVPAPEPTGDQVRVRVRACGVCRTDLHVVEGDLPPRKSPLIPGHQAVGVVDRVGERVTRFRGGERVGIPWLHRTCGECEYCRAEKENLCERAVFTGYVVDGGFAEYALAPEAFVYPIPDIFRDVEAAPLLCAGIIGFRSLRLSGIEKGQRLGFYGFGAAAHLAIQVARHWGVEVYAFSRDPEHQRLALGFGAAWAGPAHDDPPVKLDAAIIFAPAGELVVKALGHLKKGGTIATAGIHMTPIPPIDYRLLYHERVIRSVANNTRRDGEDLLRTAAEIPIRATVQLFPLSEANTALHDLKRGVVSGAAVLEIAKE